MFTELNGKNLPSTYSLETAPDSSPHNALNAETVIYVLVQFSELPLDVYIMSLTLISPETLKLLVVPISADKAER